MAELKPGTTMARIAELERVTAEQRQDIRELTGRLHLAEQRISQLEVAARLAGNMALWWRPMSEDDP